MVSRSSSFPADILVDESHDFHIRQNEKNFMNLCATSVGPKTAIFVLRYAREGSRYVSLCSSVFHLHFSFYFFIFTLNVIVTVRSNAFQKKKKKKRKEKKAGRKSFFPFSSLR